MSNVSIKEAIELWALEMAAHIHKNNLSRTQTKKYLIVCLADFSKILVEAVQNNKILVEVVQNNDTSEH